MKSLFLLFLSLNAFAGISQDVLLRGKIMNEFDEKKVKIKDSEDQVYFLPRHLFPKDISIKQGQSFSFDVDEKELTKVKLLKK